MFWLLENHSFEFFCQGLNWWYFLGRWMFFDYCLCVGTLIGKMQKISDYSLFFSPFLNSELSTATKVSTDNFLLRGSFFQQRKLLVQSIVFVPPPQNNSQSDCVCCSNLVLIVTNSTSIWDLLKHFLLQAATCNKQNHNITYGNHCNLPSLPNSNRKGNHSNLF